MSGALYYRTARRLSRTAWPGNRPMPCTHERRYKERIGQALPGPRHARSLVATGFGLDLALPSQAAPEPCRHTRTAWLAFTRHGMPRRLLESRIGMAKGRAQDNGMQPSLVETRERIGTGLARQGIAPSPCRTQERHWTGLPSQGMAQSHCSILERLGWPCPRQ